MPSFSYYLGPWAWRTDSPRPHWAPPDGTVGCIDLRSEPHCGTPAVQDGVGLFATTRALGSDYTLLGRGDLRELATSGKMRSTFEGLTRYKPSGSTLCTLLRDCLMAGGDPGGTARCKPLMPDASGNLDMYLGGHGLIHREPFSWDTHSHTPQVQAVIQGDMQQRMDAVEAGHMPLAHVQRCLDYECHKYGLTDWHPFVPAALRAAIPGRLPHATTLNDTFDRANSATLGTSSDAQFTWTDNVITTSGGDAIVENLVARVALAAGYTDSYCLAPFDLSGTDHYAQAVIAGASNADSGGGTFVRYADANNLYRALRTTVSGTTLKYNVAKRVAGTWTTLIVDTTSGYSNTRTQKFSAVGSTLSVYTDGNLEAQVTDTSLTSGLRTGIIITQVTGAQGTVDDFEAGDSAAVGVAALTAQLVWILSGVSGARNPICFKGTTLSAIWLTSGGSALTYGWVFADLHGQAGFVSTATSADITRTYSVAGGSLGTRRVSSTVSALTSSVGSTVTSAALVFVTGIKVPNIMDGCAVIESQPKRRTAPL